MVEYLVSTSWLYFIGAFFAYRLIMWATGDIEA
jgi:hypothetical protein